MHEQQWLVKIDMFTDFLDAGDADGEIDLVAGLLTTGTEQDR